MPKKFGSNTKAAEARTRKEAVRVAEREQKEKEAEDALWEDDDKHALRKQQRKDDKEKKKQELVDKKFATKVAYEEEMSSMKSAKQAPAKVTRAEIAGNVERLQASDDEKKPELSAEVPLEENLNRMVIEGDVAHTVDEAISILSTADQKVELHPERRMKAAYEAYLDLHLPQLKAENPNLRLSQLKQMLRKDWMKSPENPMNQINAGFENRK